MSDYHRDLFGFSDDPVSAKEARAAEIARREPTFDGETFDYPQDHSRLKTCLDRVATLMRDRQWRTLAEIAESVYSSEPGVSARLRDFRKAKWAGKYRVKVVFRYRLKRGGGVWIYAVEYTDLPPPAPPETLGQGAPLTPPSPGPEKAAAARPPPPIDQERRPRGAEAMAGQRN